MVPEVRRHRLEWDRHLRGEEVDRVLGDLLVDGPVRGIEIGEELPHRRRLHVRPGEQVRARGLSLLDDRDGNLAELLGQLRLVLQQLRELDRAGEPGGPTADDGDADLDPLILGIGDARYELLRRLDRRRILERLNRHYEPFLALIASVSLGTILCRSPTTPRSENSKIGAFWSLLIARMFSEFCMPTLCWIAPEIPSARYRFGATVLPVCPIWAAYGYQPASTTARVAATAPPIDSASCSASSKFSFLPSPRPPPTRMSAPSMSTSAPRCSPRVTILALVDHSDSSTWTSSTSAVPPVSFSSNAFSRPMMIPGSST